MPIRVRAQPALFRYVADRRGGEVHDLRARSQCRIDALGTAAAIVFTLDTLAQARSQRFAPCRSCIAGAAADCAAEPHPE